MNRIVVIEDDPAILRGLADNLRHESYDVLTATDGEEGYRLVRENSTDLVILDLMLPRMDGYEVCRRLRSHGLATPILMLTAQNKEAYRVQGFDAGVDDYVTKPFSIRELLGRIRAILRRSEGRPDLASQRELDEARRIQQRLLPGNIPQIAGLRISGASQPARIVGGDYYDVLRLRGGAVAVCIADVCGKGLPAAMTMSNLQAAVKAFASIDARPSRLCEQVNHVMCDNIGGYGFITFFYAVLEPAAGRLTYCNAGHNPPILAGWPHKTAFRRLDRGGGILGVFRDWTYEEETVPIQSGDCLLMYTDGVTECRSPEGEEFGESRLLQLVEQFATESTTLTQAVIDAANGFSNGTIEDDLTVVSVAIE